MDRFGSYINAVLKGLYISSARRREMAEEIRDHLEMLKTELVKYGCSEEQSELEAIQRFGDINDIKKSYKGIFTSFRWLKDTINEKKLVKEAVQWTLSIIGAVIVSLSIRSYAFAATEVRQCSMESTLYEGHRLIESKMEYYYSAPQRGDIVIINQDSEKGVLKTFVANSIEFVEGFYKNNEMEKKRLIKRVIGIPGDEIDIREGNVYINGSLYCEPYVKGSTYPGEMEFPVTVPENQYFVMGDNRENSLDSRDIGFISKDKIEGKVILRLWPLDKAGSVRH